MPAPAIKLLNAPADAPAQGPAPAQRRPDRLTVDGVLLPMQLPARYSELAGVECPVLLTAFPRVWQQKLWGRVLDVVCPDEFLAATDTEAYQAAMAEALASDRALHTAIMERHASRLMIYQGLTPIGWHCEGVGNLTRGLLEWADHAVAMLAANKRPELIRSLGGVAGSTGQTYLRYVDVLSMLKATPLRWGGAVNGDTVRRRTWGGLALICVALTSRRVQDCIKQAPEEKLEFEAGAVITNGWPQFFAPAMSYGHLGEFAANNFERFTGHLMVQFKQNCHKPELEVLAAPFGWRAEAIRRDLEAGITHIPHDQLKNSSVGGGARATWLVDGEVRSLCGAGSKPEKFLNRQKLITGQGGLVLEPAKSALRVVCE